MYVPIKKSYVCSHKKKMHTEIPIGNISRTIGSADGDDDEDGFCAKSVMTWVGPSVRALETLPWPFVAIRDGDLIAGTLRSL